MTASRPDGRSKPGEQTLGRFAAGQLTRLCDALGMDPADAETYAQVLVESLGHAAGRSLDRPPPFLSTLSDDHTPVEYSLAFTPDAPPTLRLLLEPGCGADTSAHSGRVGLRVIREMAQRWNFATDQLDTLEDLFLPASAQGAFALWCALELRPGGVPKVKVYLNPAASGPRRAAATVQEALRRLGHPRAFAALPPADGYPFFALDLGDWDVPRVKVYLRHDDMSAVEAGGLSRMNAGPASAEIQEFLRTAAGFDADTPDRRTDDRRDARLRGRPALSCHAFTEAASGRPSGFTLHIPVRDYVQDDREALARAEAVLRRCGMDTAPLLRSLAAVTRRRPQDGVGLIAYLALVHQQGRPPRVTAYVSSEAYAVRPPLARQPAEAEATRRTPLLTG
ncbi:tryptophan dimethylallyltransferase family protein [Streptomyces polyrhachis]|uniref:Tryptophan dimethylallyltransferase family protein n=1 Tax=Streptomyces polyrhachis TaxID=1282885 RepID=A0ABW2GPN5_9ACTN